MPTNAEIIVEYANWVEDHINRGYMAHMLTFMFNPLSGPEASVARQMTRAVERTYAVMLPRIVRKPLSPEHEHQRPRWIVCPDHPVPKTERQPLADLAINDGRHLHCLALTPFRSRLKEPLVNHIQGCQPLYAGRFRPLLRLDAMEITRTPEVALDYVMKALHRSRVTLDDIIILPRARSELVS